VHFPKKVGAAEASGANGCHKPELLPPSGNRSNASKAIRVKICTFSVRPFAFFTPHVVCAGFCTATHRDVSRQVRLFQMGGLKIFFSYAEARFTPRNRDTSRHLG
jgi:hypothetical protein